MRTMWKNISNQYLKRYNYEI